MDQSLFDDGPPSKRCTKCGKAKPLTDFYAMKGMRDGRRPECKDCGLAAKKARYRQDPQRTIDRVKRWQEENRERHLENQRKRRQRPEVKLREREGHLRRKFGITLEEYDYLLARQGGVCAICGRPPRDDISLHVDHDHETGAVRGLLCFRCNNALGDFDDDLVRLRAAVGYLDPRDEDEAELVELTRARVAALLASR